MIGHHPGMSGLIIRECLVQKIFSEQRKFEVINFMTGNFHTQAVRNMLTNARHVYTYFLDYHAQMQLYNIMRRPIANDTWP